MKHWVASPNSLTSPWAHFLDYDLWRLGIQGAQEPNPLPSCTEFSKANGKAGIYRSSSLSL